MQTMARVNLDRAIFWTPPVPANPEHESRNLQNQDQSQQPSLSKSESRALPRREDEGRKPSSCSGKSIEEAVLILDDDGSDDGSDNDGDDEIIDDLSDISFPSLDEMLGIGPRSRPGTSSVVFGATGNGCSTDSPLADAVEPRLETESRTRSPKSSPLPSVHAKNGLCIAGQAVTDETTCGASAQKTPDAPSAAGRIEQQSEPRQASELSLPHVPVPHFERTVPGFHGEERGSQNLLAHDLSRRTSTASSKSPAPHSEDEGRSPRSNALGDPKNGVIFISDDDDSDDEGDGDNDQSDISFPSLDETLKCTAGPNDFGPGPNLVQV
ncbi:hypothetical protein B0T17DRAFT_138858 [Bombardia bombarda]|uniref:Uncharacterized protein n=1 Tax=Bombardia bombarda TaxID=252184 RepID=A0AA40C851_9PEZI|nr:hypothetical protein B0T17DRAFT_138858 [Bombardia bombarda]